MKIMDELLDEFLKTWKKENNTEEAVYSAYHYDAMIAFAKYYHQSKVNNGVLDDVINCDCESGNYEKTYTNSGIVIYKCNVCGGCL